MSLNTRAFSMTLAIVWACAYAIGAIVHVVSPWGAPALVSYLFHVDVTSLSHQFAWDSFVVGLAMFAVTGAFFGAMIATVYNRLTRPAAELASHAAPARAT